MAEIPSSEREQRLERILADYLHAVAAGKSPDREALLTQHPEFASDLRSFFANRDALEQLTQPIAGQSPGVVRYFGDYELLGEIARGGMGVVYRARQVSLNRVVAVKMLLAGRLADESDVRRFRTEAEAAANLDHPNIVPLVEVGEHQGQHYFSMKLIEGVSLVCHLGCFRADPRVTVNLLVLVGTPLTCALIL